MLIDQVDADGGADDGDEDGFSDGLGGGRAAGAFFLRETFHERPCSAERGAL